MNRYEKFAWYSLAVEIISLVTYGIIFAILAGKIGAALASSVALFSFSLLVFRKYAPPLFKRQDLGWNATNKQGGSPLSSWRKIVYRIIFFSIFLALIILLNTLHHLPSGNSPMQVLAPALKIFFPIVIIFFFVLMIFSIKNRHSFSSAPDEDYTWYGFGFSWRGTDMDERDLAIWREAHWAGFITFCAVYIIGLMGTFLWMILQGRDIVTIDIHLIPVATFIPFVLILIVVSIATIILYRRGASMDKVDG